MTFNINWDNNGVYIKFRGIVNSQDLIDANNYLISNANFDTIKYQLFDFLDIEEFQIGKADMEIIGTMDKSQSDFKNDMKIAIITNDDYVRKMTVHYDQFMAGSNWITKVFSNVQTARAWVLEKWNRI